MDAEIMVENLPMLGVCNLCLNEGAVKSMLLSHKYHGNEELYIEMLMKCFRIDITTLDLGDTKHLICEVCIPRLRDAAQFKNLVETSLQTLEAAVKFEKEESLLLVKQEESGSEMNHFEAGFDDDDDDMCLKDMAIKKEPKEEYTKKSKKVCKRTKLKTRKNINLSEIEAMLSLGLFPFKIRRDGSFRCPICPENSINLENIRTHLMDHSKSNIGLAFRKMVFSNSQRFFKIDTKLRCKICTTDLSNFDELKQHIENCTRLKSSYNWSHLPFKLEKDQLDCPVCKKTFLNFVRLNTHMNLHYPNFICESCGKAFASKARLRGHMRTHEVGSFACKYCNAVFDRVTKRENHVSKEHKAGIRYACKRCNITLGSFYSRQKHLAEVHNEELKRYKCKACPQSYITPGHLSSHVRRDHLNERNHRCEKCDLAFYTKNALKMHMIKHDGERIHSCNICQKSYQRKKTLREHMRIHDNDKRFVCTVCGRAFTQKCTLKGHLKVHERKVDIDDGVMQPLHSI